MIYNINNCPPNCQGIYKIEFPNGKSYIGLSNNIPRRIKEHNFDRRQPLLFRAIQKYGKIEQFEILEIMDNPTRQRLMERECFWIAHFESNNLDKGYNLTPGGDGYMSMFNPSARFNASELCDIHEMLLDMSISENKISKLYNCSEATIQRINQGHNYFNPNWDYPIRKEKKSQSGESNHNAKFSNSQIQSIYLDLADSKLSMKKLSQKYGCAPSTISAINLGKTYGQSNISYPIRKK